MSIEMLTLELEILEVSPAPPHPSIRPVPAPVGSCRGGLPDQMRIGGELLLLLSSSLYHKGSSCDYRHSY